MIFGVVYGGYYEGLLLHVFDLGVGWLVRLLALSFCVVLMVFRGYLFTLTRLPSCRVWFVLNVRLSCDVFLIMINFVYFFNVCFVLLETCASLVFTGLFAVVVNFPDCFMFAGF